MGIPAPDPLDELIESSLQDDVVVRAPLNLHRRIEQRVQYAAAQDRETRHFRGSFLWLGVACAVMLLACAGAIAIVNLPATVQHGVGGWRGWLDGLAVQYRMGWPTDGVSYLVYGAVALAVATLALVAFLPLRSRRR